MCVAAVAAHAFAANPGQQQDLAFVRDTYLSKSLAFSPEARREATAYIDGLIARNGILSDETFLLATLRIAAFAHNAHESMHGGGWMPATRLPLRMIWFPDALLIARAAPGYEDLLGARVESIEGLAPEALRARLRPLFGGTDDYLRWNGLWVVEFGGLMHAMGVARVPDRLRFRLRLRDGHEATREIAFVPRTEAAVGASPPRFWSPAPYESERAHGWKSAIAGREPPLYLREDDEPYRIVALDGQDALYVQFRANSTMDAGGRDIGAFVARVQGALAERKPRNLVLDLRFDIGGDIDTTRELAREIAAKVPGRIFVLVGPYTFSAGIVFAAAVKHDGGARVTLVGEEVGDRPRFWSEGGDVCLPRSKYCLRASNGLWDLTRGCAGDAACYGDRLEARVDSLAPDIRAPLTSADWLGGRDPAMSAVEAALGRH